MNAIRMRSRAELRTHLGGVITLALLVGVIGGVVIAAAAGARRTVSAYPRFLEAKNALDVVVKVTSPDPAAAIDLAHEVQRLPEVKDSSVVVIAKGYLRIPDHKAPGNVFPIVSFDGKLGFEINRPKILAGRMLDPTSNDELLPSSAVADQLGLHVGETVQLAYGGLFSNLQHPPPNAPSPVTMHVVGIGAMPSMFQPLAGGYLPGVLVSPRFAQAHAAFLPTHERDVVTTLHGGVAAVPHFQSVLREMKAGLPPRTGLGITFSQASQTGGVQETARAEAVALWVLAALVGVAGLAIFAQALSRQTFLESIEYPTLRSLGVTPTQLFAVGMIRVALIGLVGGVVAAVAGFLLSPLSPAGIARIAEPYPGFALDALVVGLGAVVVAALTILVGAFPAWRAATAKWTALGTAAPRRPRSGAAGRAVGAFPPSGRAGVRMALDPGAGRTAVPVRTTVFGAALTLVALAASLVFGASLNRLENKPALSGRTWDTMLFVAGNPSKPGSESHRLISSIDRNPAVSGYAVGTLLSLRIANSPVTTEALETDRGDVAPALIEGRLPEAPNEIALGTQTMQAAGAHIGGTVPVATKASGLHQMRVVGRVALPNLFFSFTRPGQGAAVTFQAARRLAPGQSQGGVGVFMKFEPGTKVGAAETAIRRQYNHVFIVPEARSSQLNSLNEVGRFPLILAGILALMAIATLAHTLITSIRRRRRDLAVLKTLGFVRGQVSGTIAWQATTFGALAVLIGLPLGVIAGRWGWNVFADHLGVVPEAVVPTLVVLLIAPATILVANLLAVLPGRIASRLRPARALRTE